MSLSLKSSLLNTPIGEMLAVAGEESLYLLEFSDSPGLVRKLERVRRYVSRDIDQGSIGPISLITQELQEYFKGSLSKFQTPLSLLGTPFQKTVWNELTNVPCGTIKSYKELACTIKAPKSYRAVANANGANNISIVIPCHRITGSNNYLGGYASGIARKKWLLQHERELRNV